MCISYICFFVIKLGLLQANLFSNTALLSKVNEIVSYQEWWYEWDITVISSYISTMNFQGRKFAWGSVSLGFESLWFEKVHHWGRVFSVYSLRRYITGGGALRISNLRKCVMGGGEEEFWESLGWVSVSLGEDFESLPPCPTSRLLSGLSLWCCLLGFLLLMCTLLPSLPLLAFPSVFRGQNNLFTL